MLTLAACRDLFHLKGVVGLVRRLATEIAAVSLISAAAAIAVPSPGLASGVTVRIMTQNMFQGTNFDKIFASTTLAEFVAAATATYEDILATKPSERAQAVARTIARERPDIVALLEAGILRTGNLPATDVQADQLKVVLSELRRLGQNYEAVAILPGVDAEAPTLFGFDVRSTDRTVIIARAGLGGPRLVTSNMQVQDYLVNNVLPLPPGLPPLVSRAGWAAADISVLGHKFRFITTHLSPLPPFSIQQAQAVEAIGSAADSDLPIVFAGDFNTEAADPSHPTFQTYQILIGAGFSDAWKQEHPNLPGYTCCQDADLKNATSALNMRIDLVLTRGDISVEDIKIVGDRASERTPSGLWPSDHAGLVATLRLKHRD